MSKTRIGNAGEHLVMAELLWRGFDAYRADRGNQSFDIACFSPAGRATRLRVKTTSDQHIKWSDGALSDVNGSNGYSVLVDFRAARADTTFYILPSDKLRDCLNDDLAFYLAHPKASGKARKPGMMTIRFFGADKPKDHGWGYQDKFSAHREDWDALI